MNPAIIAVGRNRFWTQRTFARTSCAMNSRTDIRAKSISSA